MDHEDENEEYDYAELKRSLDSVSFAIYSLVFVLGVLGNGAVIWVMGFEMKKNINTVWYLNLAVADFLVTAILPLGITQIAVDGHWPFGKFMCKMNGAVFFLSMYARIYILMVISVDRCVCVVCPVWPRNYRSIRKASCVSLGVWLLALALSSPYLVFRDTQPSSDHDKDIIRCYNNFKLSGDDSTPEGIQLEDFRYGVMIITRFLMGFVVPFTVIVSCCSVIYWLRNNRSLAGQSGRHPFKIIATVITAFFLCWAPYHIIDLIDFVNVLVTEYSETLGDVVNIGLPIANCLAFLNSCLNPLLYVFMGQDFKDELESFTEELPQTNTSTNPGNTTEELPQTNTSTNPGNTTEEIALTKSALRHRLRMLLLE